MNLRINRLFLVLPLAIALFMIAAVLSVQPLVPGVTNAGIINIAIAAEADENFGEEIPNDQFDHIENPDEITDFAVDGTADGIDAISGELDLGLDLDADEDAMGDELIYPTEADDEGEVVGAGTADGAAWVPLAIVFAGLVFAAVLSFVLASRKAKAIKEAQMEAVDPAAQMVDPAAMQAVDPMQAGAQAAVPQAGMPVDPAAIPQVAPQPLQPGQTPPQPPQPPQQ